MLVLLNAGAQDVEFVLPAAPAAGWLLELDTAQPELAARALVAAATVPAHGLLILTSAPGRA